MSNEVKPTWADIKELSDLLGVKVPIDGLISALAGKLTVDIIKLDDALIAKYDYEIVGSMADFIRLGYGDRAYYLINLLL